MTSVLLDTVGLIAVWDVDDQWHAAAENAYQRIISRLLTELHRDSLYPMMGKDTWVAGADRREAPGPKPGCAWASPPGSAASHPDPGSSGMVEFSEESHYFPATKGVGGAPG